MKFNTTLYCFKGGQMAADFCYHADDDHFVSYQINSKPDTGGQWLILSPENELRKTLKISTDRRVMCCTLLLRSSWKERVRLQDRLGLRSESLTRAFSTHVWLRTVKRGVS